MRIQLNLLLKVLLANIFLACLFTTYKHSKLISLPSISISSSSSSSSSIPTFTLNETILSINSLISDYSVDLHHLLTGIYTDENRHYYFLHFDDDHRLEWRRFCDSRFNSNIFRYLSIPKIINSSLIPPLEIFKPCLSLDSISPVALPLNRTLLAISSSNSLSKTIRLLDSLKDLSENFDILVIDDMSTDGTLESLQKMVCHPSPAPTVRHPAIDFSRDMQLSQLRKDLESNPFGRLALKWQQLWNIRI
jgi:hypothetical protein